MSMKLVSFISSKAAIVYDIVLWRPGCPKPFSQLSLSAASCFSVGSAKHLSKGIKNEIEKITMIIHYRPEATSVNWKAFCSSKAL
jgi:hypothetical protein